ncbi:ABC transporter permease subunit, partial [Telmatospirillum sp.]|uniref:sugar ABC transporter permease n=1 Tax=Telmatospirillum sp. TaxID=2079197 RepID=UPI0028427CCE
MITKDLRKVFSANIREYGMYIALVVIMGIFQWLTNGLFLSSRNIVNLFNQSGYIAVLAVGVTLVIVIRQIDMSIGFLAGFLGAIAAIALVQWHLPVAVVIPGILALGVCAGLVTAYPVARMAIPSFVTSLAGWLIYRGLLLVVTGSTGTIIIPNAFYNEIGNGFIPDIFATDAFLPGIHKTTLVLGLIALIWFVISETISRRQKQSYDFEVLPLYLFVAKLVSMSAILAVISWIVSGYNGLSWTVVIVLAVVITYEYITTKTVLGRHIYAVGGNPEAAELSGISVRKITFLVFGSMGLMAALSGILFSARLKSALPTAGTLFELDAIAAAYIGGVSAAGGVGSITGSLLGTIVYMCLMNGLNLLNTDIALQYVVR